MGFGIPLPHKVTRITYNIPFPRQGSGFDSHLPMFFFLVPWMFFKHCAVKTGTAVVLVVNKILNFLVTYGTFSRVF